MTGPWILKSDLDKDPAIVDAIKQASLDWMKRAQSVGPHAPDPIAFVVTVRQFEAMLRSAPLYGAAWSPPPSATLWGVQVLVAADGWSCPSNLTDLRAVGVQTDE